MLHTYKPINIRTGKWKLLSRYEVPAIPTHGDVVTTGITLEHNIRYIYLPNIVSIEL